MGVPGFFSWLLRNDKKNNIIVDKINEDIDNMYLDANCLFHPQCFKILAFYENKLSVEKLEDKMIKRIINYIDFLIEYVKPIKKVFIAVDGVAPMAKMNQQRKRRYKSVVDNEMKNEINRKFGKTTTTIWSNSAITPGTKFMEKLHLKIIEYIKNKIKKLNVTFIYSSYHTIGEGEHKILQDIKKDDNNFNAYVIYGLDADLIFLALASGKDKIYLLREEIILKKSQESTHIEKNINDVTESLTYVSIDETKNCINDQINSYIEGKINNDNYINNINSIKKDFINDFIVICYFLGNDFIPNIPSIEIKNGGIDFLIDTYVNTYMMLQNGLTYIDTHNKVVIDNVFFETYIRNIAKYEDYYFRVKFPKFLDYVQRKQCLSDDLYEQEIWNLENMKSYITINIVDNIKLGYDKADLWKFRFYEHYYGVTNMQNQDAHIDAMCNDYLNGISWTMQYYFDKCNSFGWQYKYNHTPFASDINAYLKKTKCNINDIVVCEITKITPFIQLLAVLPPTYHNLLPQQYGKLMHDNNSPIIDMCPKNIKIDMLYKDSFHKCIPLIPNINIERIIDSVKNIKLTQEENNRNNITNQIIFNY